MKRILITATLALTLAGHLTVGSRAAQLRDVSAFMRVKLTHSQKVLEAIALEDYRNIGKHAQEMKLMSQEASWKVLQTVEYSRHSDQFRRTADGLIKAADEKNLDGAALAYFQLTMTCVNCHRYVRDTRSP